MVLFTLVDLQSTVYGPVSETVKICPGNVLTKSLNWWKTLITGLQLNWRELIESSL